MTQNRHVILAIDEGTSGTRAAVVDVRGQVSCLQYLPLRVESPRSGVVEQDANAILAKTIDVCRATLAEATTQGLQVVALAVTTQRATSVLWDKQTGHALVPAMVWQDNRHADELEALAARWDATLLDRIGRPSGVRSPYLWAVHHMHSTPSVQQALCENRLAFGTIDTWLLWHLSNERICVTTPTNAASANAYLLAEHRYFLEWIDALGFPRSLLPELRQDADNFGRTRFDVLGIDVPILACAGDQLAGAIGLGCLERGQAMCVHGTGSFVDLLIGRSLPPRSDKARDATLTMTARRQDGISHHSLETFVATTGSALNRMCENLRWFESPRQISALAATVGSARGVAFLPAFAGLRVPQLQPNARASLTGISIATTQAEIAYAILEGVAQSVALCMDANQAVAGIEASELVVGGGLSVSNTLLQIQTDLGGLPVRRMRDGEHASLRGAAFLAGSSGLMWDSLQHACANITTDTLFEPGICTDSRTTRRVGWQARVDAELAHASAFVQGYAGDRCA